MAVATAVLLAAACNPADHHYPVRFALTWGGAAVACGTRFGGGLTLTDFRLYLAEPRLHAAGEWHDPTTAGAVWLLDLEDGSGECRNGSPAITDTVTVSSPVGSADGFDFMLGVPFSLNHNDPLTAAAPLNDPQMHWHWRSGYKFMRIGLKEADERWHVHLGSTGCRGAIGAVEGCERPNRARLEVRGWHPGQVVELDLQRLLDGVPRPLGASSHCLGERDDPVCRRVMQNLGLDPDSGRAATPAPFASARAGS